MTPAGHTTKYKLPALKQLPASEEKCRLKALTSAAMLKSL